MSLWKISVKSNAHVNGVRLDKAMYVEMEAPLTSNPINVNLLKNRPTINMLFMSKYGVDLLKANLISPSYLSAERI